MKSWSEFRESAYLAEERMICEGSDSSFYIFRTDNNQVLARGVRGYDAAKARASDLRKRFGLKFDQVRFKVERKPGLNTSTTKSTSPSRNYYGKATRRGGSGTYRGGRIDTASNFNPSKRTRFRGVSYSDGSYADLD